jgi:hypothetical protein
LPPTAEDFYGTLLRIKEIWNPLVASGDIMNKVLPKLNIHFSGIYFPLLSTKNLSIGLFPIVMGDIVLSVGLLLCVLPLGKRQNLSRNYPFS